MGLFVEVGVYIEGSYLLADQVIGLVLAPIGKGVTGFSRLAPLPGSSLASIGDPRSTWIGFALIPSSLV